MAATVDLETTFNLVLGFLAPPGEVSPHEIDRLDENTRRQLEVSEARYKLAQALRTSLSNVTCNLPPVKLSGGFIAYNWDQTQTASNHPVDPAQQMGRQHWVINEEGYNNQEPALGEPVDIVLKSPMFDHHEVTEGYSHVNIALPIVHRAFSGCAKFSKTSALRVQVNYGNTITPLIAKRVASLVLILERPLLFPFCAPHRQQIHGSLDQTARFCTDHARRPLSPEATRNLPSSVRQEWRDQLALLWDCNSIKEVRSMLADTAGGHARPAFALVNVGKGSDIWVLEFCHAQASLRRTFINPWTSLILGIFQLALLTEREFCWAMAQLWEDAKPSAGERWRYLLDTINSWHHRMRISVYLSGSDWTERLKGYEERQNEIEDMDTFCDMTLID